MASSYERMAEAVGRGLARTGLTIACAESCTGGLLTSTLTDVPGSSAYVMGSVVSYSNDVKVRVLGVSSETLTSFGAVSEQTAREMAEGVRRLMLTDIGVGITGIAGPGGGSHEKPVGLVYIAAANADRTKVQKYFFSGDRMENKSAAVHYALSLIQDMIRSADQ